MPLTVAEIADVRRFAGYPAAAAVAAQGLDVQGGYAALTAALASLADPEVADIRSLLVQLRLLEADILAMRDSVDTRKAAVWERNQNELAERATLFLMARRRLCSALGVSAGPGLFAEAAGVSASCLPAVFLV